MAGEVDLCNDALGQVGADSITSLDDENNRARRCKTFYAPVRDAALISADWNFAIARAELQQETTAPVFEYNYSYTLPADCLRVIRYAASNLVLGSQNVPETISAELGLWVDQHYRVEGRSLVCNDGQVWIEYLKQETNVGIWHPLFYQAVARMLASKLAASLWKDANASRALADEATQLLIEAAGSDGTEGTALQMWVPDLITERWR